MKLQKVKNKENLKSGKKKETIHKGTEAGFLTRTVDTKRWPVRLSQSVERRLNLGVKTNLSSSCRGHRVKEHVTQQRQRMKQAPLCKIRGGRSINQLQMLEGQARKTIWICPKSRWFAYFQRQFALLEKYQGSQLYLLLNKEYQLKLFVYE